MINLNSPETSFTIRVVRQASLLVEQVQRELVSSALTKEDRSPVTVADFASQALVGYLIAEAFPEDPLVAEEDSTALLDSETSQTLEAVTHFVNRFGPRANPQSVCNWIDHGRVDSASRFWTLDPIDGTKGFLRGDQYVVALALVVDGQVQVAALGCPRLAAFQPLGVASPGDLVIAARDRGTWATSLATPGDFERLRVSGQVDPSCARLLRSFEPGHTNVDQIDTFAQALGIQAEPVRMDSQAKYVLLAFGIGDLLVRLLSPSKPAYREKIWDQAAGSLILEEAGGRITDLDGKRLDFTSGRALSNNRGILASNGTLHAAALQALQDIGA